MLNQFYADVLPRSGQFALFLGTTKQHVWAGSQAELVALTEERIDDEAVYFATASFKTRDNRTQENVLLLRALRLDIDAGDEKYAKHPDDVYRTQRDALAAFVAFSKAAGLAPTYVVSSGAGLHVYYCLDTDIEPVEWLPLARRLQQLAVERGLLVDSKVTTDSARVLRPLGTPHWSGSRVAVLLKGGPIYAVEALRQTLGVSRFSEAALAVNADNDTSPEFQGPPVSVNKIIPKCAALANAASNPLIAEPYWRAMIGLVKHTIEGDEACHRFSEDYPGYDEHETQKKIDNWRTGPTTCDEFSQHFKGCAECPHRGQIKSPIRLGWLNTEEVKELPPEQQPQITVPPVEPGKPWEGCIDNPYYLDQGERLCIKLKTQVEGDNGEKSEVIVPVVITSTPFWATSWAEFGDEEDTSLVQFELWNGRTVRSFTMDMSTTADAKTYLKTLAGKGIHLSTDARSKKAMDDYLKYQLERIRTLHVRSKYKDRLGIRIEDGKLLALHGRHVISADGTISEAMLGGELPKRANQIYIAPLRERQDRQFKPDVWHEIRNLSAEHVAFIQRYYSDPALRAFQLTIMMLLASPLMPFVTGQYRRQGPLPSNGLTVSLYSRRSGRGKTTACKMAMMAFGDPEALTKPRSDKGVTDIQMRALLSQHGTMPFIMDEMGESDAKRLAGLISAVANSEFRERRDTKYGSETPWALINVLTLNVPARDLIQQARAESSAIQYRLLELDVDDVPSRPDDVAKVFEFELGELAARASGALGAFIQLVLCRMGVDGVNELVRASVERARELTGNSQEGRFQWRAMGAVLALQTVLEKLGLHIFEREALEATFVDAFKAGNDYIKDATLPATAADMVGLMMADLRPYTLVTDTETHRGHNPNARDMVLNVGGVPREVKVRSVRNLHYAYVSAEAIKEWCNKRGLSHVTLVKDACKQGVFLRMGKDLYKGRVDLFKGTTEDGAGAVQHVYKVDMKLLASTLDELPENVVTLPVGGPVGSPFEGRKVE